MEDKGPSTVRLLFVTREPSSLPCLWEVGDGNSWQVETAYSGLEALERVQSGVTPSLVLLELVPGDPDSLHTLRWLRRVRPQLPVVLLSQAEDTQQMMQALRLGAQDFLLKPCQPGQLDKVIKRQLAALPSRDEGDPNREKLEQPGDDLLFVAVSPAMRRVRAQVESLAQVNVPVLILGERGSGKHTTARMIHRLSIRSGFRFFQMNCASLPGNLLEQELFGGPTSGVHSFEPPKPGRLELCQQGTVLLDQVSEMAASLQAGIAQLLREKRFVRNGHVQDVDVRILASIDCGSDLSLPEGMMHEDLFYLLSAFTIYVPPLRQRKMEIPILLSHFMTRLARHYGMAARNFSPRVLEGCEGYSWPGNLPELEDFAKRYLMLGDDSLPPGEMAAEENATRGPGGGSSRQAGGAVDSASTSLKSLVKSVKDEAERNAIAGALDKTHWNRKAAARLLRISYRALLYKIQEYRMSPPGGTVVTINRTKVNGPES
jgi:two-component system response regulator AtoC